MALSYIAREEDGTSRLTLEEGPGSLLLEEATALNARVSQEPVEVLDAHVSNARLSQEPVEVLVENRSLHTFVSQVVLEVLVPAWQETAEFVFVW